MTNLVIMKDQQAVTTSLQVAENFEKQHKHVLEAIDELMGAAENSADLFYEDTYIHPQNKQSYRMIYMNRDGFTLLAMGFTGKKALEFKFKYIAAFNEMEKELNKPRYEIPNTPQAALRLMFEYQEETTKKVDKVEERVTDLEENVVLSAGDYGYISRRINQRVAEVARGFGKLTNKQRGELHRDINAGVKAITGVTVRTQLRNKHLETVLSYITDWEPSTATKVLVRQMNLDLEEA